MSILRVEPCSYRAARLAVTEWHYSRVLPTPPLVKFGVWEDDRFVGVVIFSRGAALHLGKRWSLHTTEICELTRVALQEHESPVSQIVSEAVRLLHDHSPRLRLIVSFADPAHGHVGAIYQAMNWIYLGESAPAVEYVDVNGRRWHGRMVSAKGYKKVYGEMRQVVRTSDCTPVEVPGKHRYALPLDRKIRRILLAQAMPYPKKVAIA